MAGFISIILGLVTASLVFMVAGGCVVIKIMEYKEERKYR